MSPPKVGNFKHMGTVIEKSPLRNRPATTMQQQRKARPKTASGDKFVRYFADMVQPQHKISKEQAINQFETLLKMEKEVGDPKDELRSISRKITAWK